MSFQTMKYRQNNYQEDFKIQPVKMKVPQLTALDEEASSKRFNRSQSRQNYNTQHNKPPIPQEAMTKIYEQPYVQKKDTHNKQELLRISKNMKDQVLMQKFIPYTLKDLRKQNQVANQQNILSQKGNVLNSPSLQAVGSPLNRKFIDNHDKYTFRSFGNSSVEASWQYGDNVQISDAKSIKSFVVSQAMSPRSPNVFLSPNGLKHDKSPMVSPYNKKSAKNCEGNVSTQESFQQGKRKQTKKVSSGNIGIQTQNKKVLNAGICTIAIKMISIKIQTEETSNSYMKFVEAQKGKIEKMEQQNSRLRNQIGKLKRELKQKNQLSIPSACIIGQRAQNENTLSEKSRNGVKSRHLKNKTELLIQKQTSQTQLQTQAEIQMSIENQLEQDLEKSSNKLKEEHQSFKQFSRQLVVQNLKKEIELLKSGMGIKKIQQVLEHLKRQNVGLVNQIQSVSLRCRILEQQNSQIQVLEQENRKIKMQNKYFRGIAKDHQLEIEKLKNQNNKLKNLTGPLNKKVVMYQDFQDSRLVSVCGSDADSLTLSCSFIKD